MSDAANQVLPVPLDQLPQEIVRFVDPASPARLRMMAARSMVPLGAGQLITVLYLLCFDSDPQIVAEAQSSLGKIPDEVLRPALVEALPGAVLDYLARALVQSSSHLEPLLLNRALPLETVCWLAGVLSSEDLLELIANNQDRLLRFPKIIESLYFNPRTRQSTMDRVMDFAIRCGLDLSGIPAYKEAAAALGYTHLLDQEQRTATPPPLAEEPHFQTGASPTEEDGIFAEVLLEAHVEAEQEVIEGEEEPALEGYDLFGEEQPQKAQSQEPSLVSGLEGYVSGEATMPRKREEGAKNRANRIANMRASQKIRLAMLGSTSDRMLLIRDPQKIIALAAIKSPKVNQREVEYYAGSPSVNVEVIRFIAYNREWTKDYRTKLKLVLNPKCPVGQAIGFLKYLRRSDIKALSVNRNVPEAVASAARSMVREQQAAEERRRGPRGPGGSRS